MLARVPLTYVVCISNTELAVWLEPFAFREAVLFDPTALHCPIACEHRGPLVSIYSHAVLCSYSCTYVCSFLGPLTFREPDLVIAKASSSSLKLIGLCWADVAPSSIKRCAHALHTAFLSCSVADTSTCGCGKPSRDMFSLFEKRSCCAD